MTDSNDQDRKKVLSLSGKGKLELKNKPAADSSVRQSFSHGRSKTVTVEVKRKRTIEKGAAPGVADRRRGVYGSSRCDLRCHLVLAPPPASTRT